MPSAFTRTCLSLALTLAVATGAQAANHREAPLTALDHKADITDSGSNRYGQKLDTAGFIATEGAPRIMNRNEAESLAGEYVLGSLNGPELAEFEANLARNPELQRLVAAWERRLTPLAATLPEAQPRTSLWDAIETALDEAGPPTTVTVREREGEWRPLAPGAEIKLLMVDREAGFQSFLLRLAPGCQLPPHDHNILEELFPTPARNPVRGAWRGKSAGNRLRTLRRPAPSAHRRRRESSPGEPRFPAIPSP